jgi:hypothetical protein
MSARAKEYHAYARECILMAERADSEETRNGLLELAQLWSNAALIEEESANKAVLYSFSGSVH